MAVAILFRSTPSSANCSAASTVYGLSVKACKNASVATSGRVDFKYSFPNIMWTLKLRRSAGICSNTDDASTKLPNFSKHCASFQRNTSGSYA